MTEKKPPGPDDGEKPTSEIDDHDRMPVAPADDGGESLLGGEPREMGSGKIPQKRETPSRSRETTEKPRDTSQSDAGRPKRRNA